MSLSAHSPSVVIHADWPNKTLLAQLLTVYLEPRIEWIYTSPFVTTFAVPWRVFVITGFCCAWKVWRKNAKNYIKLKVCIKPLNKTTVNRSIELYLYTFSVHQARFLSSRGSNVSRKISCTAFWPADTIIDVIHQPSTFSGIISIFSIFISFDGIVHMLLEVMIHS